MTTTSTRPLWKGAISFGLVHIPIALHSATSEQGLDFDWLDRRTRDPVGYKRINKRTGKEIDREDIVKGIRYDEGQYVVLSNDEIESAYPEAAQTIEIDTFVPASDIPFIYLTRPYYVAPANKKAAKVYALLREVLQKSGKAGVARVVIQTKQHLAALIPFGPLLVLNLLRWGDQIRTFDTLALPAEGAKANRLSEQEMQMGEQLVASMSSAWNPDALHDSFRTQILRLVEAKVHAGKIDSVAAVEPTEARPSATVYDLTELLQRSLDKGKRGAPRAKPPAKPARKSPTRRKTG